MHLSVFSFPVPRPQEGWRYDFAQEEEKSRIRDGLGRFSRSKKHRTMEGQPLGADYGATQQPMGMPPGGQPIVIQQKEPEKDNTCCIVVICLVLLVCCPCICFVAWFCGIAALLGIAVKKGVDEADKADKAASDSSSFLEYPTTATTEARRRRRFEAPQ